MSDSAPQTNRAGSVISAHPALNTARTQEIQGMSRNVNNTEELGAARKSVSCGDTWQPIGEVIARQVAPEVARRVREGRG